MRYWPKQEFICSSTNQPALHSHIRSKLSYIDQNNFNVVFWIRNSIVANLVF